MKFHFVPALLSVLVAPMAPLASAAFVQVWQLGVDNDSQGEFSQETGSNVAPGAVTPVNAVTPAQAADPAFNLTTHDDDFYFAGTYASPIGVVTNTEPLKALDRALTGDVNGANGDIWDRVHFNLDQASVVGSTELRLTIDLIGLGYWDASDANAGSGSTAHDLKVSLNGVTIGTQTGISAATTWVLNTTAGAVGATTGENVLEITRTGGLSGDASDNAGWIQYDFVRLESQSIPEPASLVLLAAAAGGVMMVRRRRF